MNNPAVQNKIAEAVATAFLNPKFQQQDSNSQELKEWKQELELEAKYRAAALAANDPEAGGVPGMWRDAATEGHEAVPRLNKLLVPIGAALLTAYIAVVSNDIYQVTVGSVKAVEAARTAKDAGLYERLTTAPWATIKGAVVGAVKDESAPRPVLDNAAASSIRWQATAQLNTDDVQNGMLTKASDAPSFIEVSIKSLNETGRLPAKIGDVEMKYAPLTDLKDSWSNPATGKFDMPRVNVADGAVWIASAVLTTQGESAGFQVQPWVGVFKRTEGPSWWSRFREAPWKTIKESVGYEKAQEWWVYLNVKLPTLSSYAATGYETVNPTMVPYAFATAFPTLMKAPESKTDKRGDQHER